LASALAWGARGRQFESGHPDKKGVGREFIPIYREVWPPRQIIDPPTPLTGGLNVVLTPQPPWEGGLIYHSVVIQ